MTLTFKPGKFYVCSNPRTTEPVTAQAAPHMKMVDIIQARTIFYHICSEPITELDASWRAQRCRFLVNEQIVHIVITAVEENQWAEVVDNMKENNCDIG